DGALTLYPALRLDFYRLEPQDDRLYPDLNRAAQDHSRLSPKLGAVAKLGGTARLFANYTQGFRAPTPFQVNNFFSNPAFGYTSDPNPDLGPERSESWEGGIRFGGQNVSVSATAFTADYEDFIAQADVGGSGTPSDPTIFQYVNIGRVKIEGIEAKAEMRAASGLTGRFAIAYAKGDEILPDGTRVPLDTIDPLNLVAGIGYREPAGRFGGELIVTHHARKEATRTSATAYRPDSVTILDATGFWRVAEVLAPRGGVVNLTDTPPARKEATRTSATAYRPDSFTILDATVFWRVAEMLTLRAGVFNITDETYAYWSDVRGLSATSSVTEAYTRPGRNASASV